MKATSTFRAAGAPAALRLTPISPFGLLVEADESAGERSSLWAIAPETVKAWVAAHRVVVLRGFGQLPKTEIPGWCRGLGEPQAWDFGTVNELRAEADAANYLYTPAAVPLHWDGAFAATVPEYIFFHCLQAPPVGTGGETVFVDTSKVCQGLTPEDQDALAVTFTYKTEKLAHYGGSRSQPLLATHPRSGEAVLRYAEPVYSHNPVSLRAEGLDALHQEALQSRLDGLLHDPRVELVHRWADGDYLIADNHALLHGRRAYTEPATRHLRRVNIVPPTPGTWLSRLIGRIRLRRPEFLVAELPVMLIPLLLMAASPSILLQPLIWEGLLALYLLFNFGDLINCYIDRDLDSVYKPKLSQTVYSLGIPALRREIALVALVGLGLCGHVAWSLGRPGLVPLWLLGLWLAGQYSLPPLRMKSGGLLQVLGWWSILFAGPMLFAAMLVAPVPRWEVLCFMLSFGTMQSAILLVNSAEDYPEDRETGMRTVAVALGLVPGMAWAARLITLAGLVHFALLLSLSQGHAPWLQILTVAGTGFWIWVCSRLWQLKGRVQAEPDKALAHIRQSARLVPLYMTVLALGNLAWVLAWSL